MAEANLPEEVIVNIISRLPVKSLLRFTSVSKQWRSIILLDKQFENELRRNKTLTRSLLLCSWPPQLESLDLEMTSFRKLNFPFDRAGGSVALLGSCNGLVFAFVFNRKVFYVFNPLTGFVKELPSTDYYFRNVRLHDYGVILSAYGVGYLPATDEYKVIVKYSYYNNEEDEDEDEDDEEDGLSFEIISSKDQSWRRIRGPEDEHLTGQKGTLVNEALHWLNGPKPRKPYEIVAFDFAKEEFRKMELPNYAQDGKDFSYLGVCAGGCLCVSRYPFHDCDSIDFWVMTEYGVSESWTKLFSLRFSNPERLWTLRAFLITENYTVARIFSGTSSTIIRISHKQEEGEEEPSFDIFHNALWSDVIEYEESLVSVSGYNGF
ncbi:PREDICTED: F-box protein CPR30-like [Fragaria vesca subsp. vesca]|uniref:F-box protein CPR30-like n=1 Tax=Fragaria vesca subsp. vesca TaxID=101020 RepID=UPI0002C35194|nr:PREDICTED: F-box protein CPR30-like [Fragaria vesca subsp. vesca]